MSYIKLPITRLKDVDAITARKRFFQPIYLHQNGSSIIAMITVSFEIIKYLKTSTPHQGRRGETNVFMFYIRFQLNLLSLLFSIIF